MLACKFHFIFYFYLPLKTCNFNYSNLLLLINISVGKRHCNHQPCSHINGICWSSLLMGGWALFQIFKKGGTWQDLRFWMGLMEKRDVTFFRESCSCYIKNKLKSEIFNDSYYQVQFSYTLFFELVWLTLAPINTYITERSNFYMAPIYTRSNK